MDKAPKPESKDRNAPYLEPKATKEELDYTHQQLIGMCFGYTQRRTARASHTKETLYLGNNR